jgi:hypothetical protein
MIWVGYKAPNSPLSDNYGSDGKPVPWQTNVSLGGVSWDVYLYTYVLTTFAFLLFLNSNVANYICYISWSNGGHTMSYLDRANSGWFSGSLTPFFNHGWYTGDQYLNSVMAGWEFGKGSYTASSWGAVGF